VEETTPAGTDFNQMADLSDDDFEASMQESAESASHLKDDRAQRFYDRVRGSIQRYIEKKGKAVEKTGEYLLLVPDVFILLWRLTNDSRVSGKNKVLLGSSLAYYLFPFDLIPEGIVGPIGYLDDLVFGVYVLNRMLADTDVAILREHWSGSEDILLSIRRVLDAADNLVGSNFMERLKKLVK